MKNLLVFDIGGVFCSFDKSNFARMLADEGWSLADFFDESFTSFQTGLMSFAIFFTQKSAQLRIDRINLIHAFGDMCRVYNQELLLKLKLPFIFASNINELHFKRFEQQVRIPSSSIASSYLSYRVGCLKPEPQFFSGLAHLLNKLGSHGIFIDDQELNLTEASKHGLTPIACPSVEALPQLLKRNNFIT